MNRAYAIDEGFCQVAAFVPCRSLSTLYISTYNRGIRYLRLQELLSDSGHLRKAVVDVGESVLSYQLQWAFTGKSKLRELHVTGELRPS